MTPESMNEEAQDLSPDQQLAGTVTDALVNDGFVNDARKPSFSKKLAAGQLKAEDWRTHAAAAIRPASEGDK